ncbi:unnamed protein product (macronuclear) [Paramecium tetraurelia]|uniref:Uncharacterized protein n=1 Tax=Paramecium tetraurelia TaxID=5888 RepID=A0BKV9_PARTE|nr:uncharacterized protein GSPATT00029807001 [Paramecium tetraurelia]CAK59176.1 unnamed protein product [Paramecium tetraurelia]|eukprot:XP_001426574.1 hypothetical protein (macronuclear) [Paramecium tetraurelia strain d4-2]
MNHNTMKHHRPQRALTTLEKKYDRSAFINRNPKTMLRDLLFEQNVQQNQQLKMLQTEISKEQKIYSIDIPDLDEYFGMKDQIQIENCIQDCKKKVNVCKNRLEQLKFKINDQYIQEMEDQDISEFQQIQQPKNCKTKQEGKDYYYYQNRIHTTISDNYSQKTNQVDKFNQTLYFLMSNRDRSLEEKSEKLNNTIQGQRFLDDTQNDLKKSLNYSVRQSLQQKNKFLSMLQQLSKEKESIDNAKRKRLQRLRKQILEGQFAEI